MSIVMDSKRPAFKGQTVIDSEGIYTLDPENQIIVVHDFLSDFDVGCYLEEADKVKRYSCRAGWCVKPREEVCYTLDGMPYTYSGVAHPTTTFPPHVLDLLQLAEERVYEEYGSKFESLKLSTGVDILYSDKFERGGSIAPHTDDEQHWPLVLIVSFGQTRYLRVRSLETKKWFNVEMRHNSIIAMHGKTFQDLYTHQVDKLSSTEPVGKRYSINARYTL